jgi:hypothetical protein
MLFIKRFQRSLYVNTQYFFFSSLFHLYFLIDKTFLFFSRTISRSTVMACFAFLIPFLIRFVLYFGNNLISSSDNSLRVEIAALAISRVITVVLSDAFNRVNDFATLSMIRIFCLDNFTIFNIRHGLNTLHFLYAHRCAEKREIFPRFNIFHISSN